MQGLDGRSTVRDALALEHVNGQAGMTPAGIAAKAKAAGLTGVDAADVLGRRQGDRQRHRRALLRASTCASTRSIATGGKTYAQMPRFATEDGKGTATSRPQARRCPTASRCTTRPVKVWVTETALSTALNTSYMAEQISLFGIAVGGAFLLVGLAFGAVALGGVRMPSLARATARRPRARGGHAGGVAGQPRRATMFSRT